MNQIWCPLLTLAFVTLWLCVFIEGGEPAGSNQQQTPGVKLTEVEPEVPTEESTDKPEVSETEVVGSAIDGELKEKPALGLELDKPDLAEKEPEEPKHEFNLVLPTKNQKIFDEPEQFYMHTNRFVDGVNIRPWKGGSYGFVRNPRWVGYQTYFTRLHEGVDIKPLFRDSSYVPLDKVCSISDGIVMYCKTDPWGGYGRYIVVKHNWPEGSFYSLYAHLAKCIAEEGAHVKAGDTLGILGDSGRGLDRERAHLHLELNFLMSEDFDSRWSPGNQHKNFCGLNMIGLDIAKLFIKHRKDPNITIEKFLAGEDPYFKVKSINVKKPGLLERHPWLGRNMDNAANTKGWEWTFTQEGVPLAIEPFVNYQQYTDVSWVKPSKSNHSYMTSSRIVGSGKTAYLSSKGHRFIALFSETFH